ncbi:MAG: hypothetical protein ABFS19_05440 [Thermodesulfobacteriota bacterium]
MTGRLFYPFLRSNSNRLFGDGRRCRRSLLLGCLGALVCIAIYLVSLKVLRYFHGQNELGIILSLKIFQMSWITIFAMLIFSSMVTAVSTLYLSKDNEIMVSAPVSPAELYLMRYTTTSLYTSWMVLIFSIPYFGAFAPIFNAGPLYWPLLLMVTLSTTACASAGAILLTVFLVKFFPAKQTKDIVFYLSLCFGIFLYLIFRLMRPEDLVNPDKYGQFIEYLSAISTPAGPWLPAGWAANMLSDYLLDQRIDILLGALLIITPLALYLLGEIAMGWWFADGFNKSQESFGGHRKFPIRRTKITSRQWIFKKELNFFIRDSSEWSQLFMIGALIVVYLYNFQVLPLDRAPMPTEYITNLIGFANIGLCGFLNASLAARFVYPSIGAEGGAFYLILSSPLPLIRFFLYKFLFYCLPFSLLTLILIGVSNYFLQVSTPMWWISLFAGLLISWTNLALALGFGALFADFKAENKAASMGPGAIFFLFCAILLELLILVLGVSPSYMAVRSWLAGLPISTTVYLLLLSWGLGSIIIVCSTAGLLWKKGLAKLQGMEGEQ